LRGSVAVRSVSPVPGVPGAVPRWVGMAGGIAPARGIPSSCRTLRNAIEGVDQSDADGAEPNDLAECTDLAFVEVDRDVITLDPKQAYRPEEFDALRHFRSGNLKWPDLLRTPRVILLAGAASGKSEEFRQRTAQIVRNAGFAVYLTIERLEAAGLEGSLNLSDRARLTDWRRATERGWFFLNSIDEARINHKDVELALNRFAADLGEAYDRAGILLSCRGSAWTGDPDMALVANALPVRSRALREDQEPIDPDEALLAKRDKASSARVRTH